VEIHKRKLIFYSDQLIPQTAELDQHLLALIGKERSRIGYIPSAGDPTRKYYQAQKAYYARYGIDLDPYFELDDAYKPDDLDALLTADAIHLSGGNTFYFLYRLRARNLSDLLRQYVTQGGVLVGVSAGAILMTPDIRTSLLCGDMTPSETIEPNGLGLVDFAFVPHLGRFGTMANLESFSKQNHIMIYACPDNAGIVVEDDCVQCIGDVVTIKDRAAVLP
jgi:dipeptidase E